MGGTISANIFFPALSGNCAPFTLVVKEITKLSFADLQKDLHASNGLLGATVSLFILGQGIFPMFWSGISEIKGRKACYVSALCEFLRGDERANH